MNKSLDIMNVPERTKQWHCSAHYLGIKLTNDQNWEDTFIEMVQNILGKGRLLQHDALALGHSLETRFRWKQHRLS